MRMDIQNIDVPLAFVSSIFNKCINDGTSSIPPPVENNPLTIPAKIPIIIFLIINFSEFFIKNMLHFITHIYLVQNLSTLTFENSNNINKPTSFSRFSNFYYFIKNFCLSIMCT